ncbi:hypothetical protein EON65_49035 [archaeon]|nr:MAG: hypothetical protein EON65_49035 [archaeon]
MNRRQQKSRVKKYTMRFDIAGCKVIEEVDDSDDDGPGVTPCDATMLVCKPIEDPRDEELYHQDEAQDNVDAGHRNVNAPELLSARR